MIRNPLIAFHRELNIIMDIDFMEAFESFAMSHYAPEPASYDISCPFSCLITILSCTSHIYTLHICIAHSLGTHSSQLQRLKLSMSASFGLHVNEELIEALQYVPELRDLSHDPATFALPRNLMGYESEMEDSKYGESKTRILIMMLALETQVVTC